MREAAAAAARRGGLVTREGQIAAAHVFEFDPAGPYARWRWIRKDGLRRGRFVLPPLPEYRAAPGRTGPPPSQSPAGGDAVLPANLAIRVVHWPLSDSDSDKPLSDSDVSSVGPDPIDLDPA